MTSTRARRFTLALTLAIAAIVFAVSAATVLGSHSAGHHYKSYGDNEAGGRTLCFNDASTAGYWDYADVSGLDNTAYHWNVAAYYTSGPKIGKFDFVITECAVSGYLFGEFAYPGAEIDFYDGYYGTGTWCGGSGPAAGCNVSYMESSGTHPHTMVNVMYGNRTYADNYTAKERKVIKCHEMGHAVGLGHTGTGGHDPEEGCMDIGTYHFDFEYPDFGHDIDMLHSIYRGDPDHLDDFGPPVGIAPRPGSEPIGGERYNSFEAFLRDHEPRALRELVEQGKLIRGKPEPVRPL